MSGKIELALFYDRIEADSKVVSGVFQIVYVSFFEVERLSCYRKTHGPRAFSESHMRT